MTLIDRLRTLQDHYSTSGALGPENARIFAESAEEIERLREALQEIADLPPVNMATRPVQNFERHPDLAVWIERLANLGVPGWSMMDWQQFTDALNAALGAPAQVAPDLVASLRTQLDEVSADYFAECDKVKGIELKLESATAQSPLDRQTLEVLTVQNIQYHDRIRDLEEDLRIIARKQKMDATSAASMRAIAISALTSTDCTCGADDGDPLDHHDISCPRALAPADRS